MYFSIWKSFFYFLYDTKKVSKTNIKINIYVHTKLQKRSISFEQVCSPQVFSNFTIYIGANHSLECFRTFSFQHQLLRNYLNVIKYSG
jgi:hypothetical protein